MYLIKHLFEQEFTHENKKVNKNYHFRKFCSTWKMTEIDRWIHLHIDTLRYCIENKTGTHCIQYTSIHKDKTLSVYFCRFTLTVKGFPSSEYKCRYLRSLQNIKSLVINCHAQILIPNYLKFRKGHKY